MIRSSCLFLLLTIYLFSQENPTGAASSPGRIGKLAEQKKMELKATDLVCVISFHEPSGDSVIGAGETAIIRMDIKNNHGVRTVRPILEIQTQASWEKSPRTQETELKVLNPGETTSHTCSFEWDSRFPTGTMQYKARVLDRASSLTSAWAMTTFNIAGQEIEKTGPAFVDVDSNIPNVPLKNKDAIAVIIGNQDYQHPDIPDVAFAIQDARSIKTYLTQILGFQKENIILLENATKSDLDLYFGTREYYKGKLYNFIKPGNSEVFIYFSGHGAPDMTNKRAYLMPVNTDPNYIMINGYPLDVFYQNLEKLPAKTITVAMDACFSGGSDRGMIIKNASPIFIKADMPATSEKLNILSSSTGDQISSWYPEGRHSLFTYYMLRGLRGEADKDGNRKITVQELKSFLEENVAYMARRLYGREQTPIIKGNLNAVFSIY